MSKMYECCGNCKEYTYEGEDRKGHCGYHGAYYYPNDYCRIGYEEGNRENVEERNGELIYR